MKTLNTKELRSISGGKNISTRATNWEDVLLRNPSHSSRATDWENVLLRDSTLENLP